MAAMDLADPGRSERATHLLGRIGHWGALLTLAILAASVVLRLTTTFDADGGALSRLPELAESAARLAHRVAAMAVTVIALLAAMVAFTTRPLPRDRLAAVATILALTAFLAILGRYTPGYKVAAVTVGNVAGGMALAAAFWWLRESAAASVAPPGRRAAVLAGIAFTAVLLQSALGAATSVQALRGSLALDALHAATGCAAALLALLAAWPHRQCAAGALPARVVAIAVVLQVSLGAFLALSGSQRPWALAWLHAMVALVLALSLVCLAARSR